VTRSVNRTSRRVASGRSGGGTALYVLMFLAASVIIIGSVIICQQRENRRSGSRPGETSVTIDHSGAERYGDDYYRDRGLKPNPKPARDPVVHHDDPPTKHRDNGGDYQFIGDAQYMRYHRPGCRSVQHIALDKRVRIASAEEAFTKGFIPCKVCRPALPVTASRPEPVDPDQPTPPRTPPRPEKPIYLSVKDVDVPFKFEVIKSAPDTYKGVVQVNMTVDVLKPLNKDDALLLARKLVAAVTKERKVNAVSIFLRSKPGRKSGIKWICTLEWAPYGNLTRANEVNTGDYRTHKFRIYQMGFFTP